MFDWVETPAIAVAREPNEAEYSPEAEGAWIGILDDKIPKSDNLIFRSVTLPDNIGTSHLLVVDILMIDASWFPILES